MRPQSDLQTEAQIVLALLCAAIVLVPPALLLMASHAYRKGAWWLPATAVTGLVTAADAVLAEHWTAHVGAVLAVACLLAAACQWARMRGGPSVTGLAAVPLACVIWANTGAPDGLFASPVLVIVLLLGLLNFAAARAAASAAPAIRALYLGLLGLLTVACTLTLCLVGPAAVALAALTLWLPPVIDSAFVAGDKHFGADAFGARCTGLLLIELLATRVAGWS